MTLKRYLGLTAALLAVAISPALAEGLDELNPAVVERLYNKDMLDPMQPVGPSAWREFKAKNPPPWKIGYASSYAGNTWRAAAMDELQNTIIPEWQSLGLVSEVVVTQSNLNDATQIQQMRQLVDQGVDAIIVCCSNPTALNATVKYAADRGVPVFSMTGYLTSEYSVNSSVNYQVAGYEIAREVVEQLGGKGNVLVVEGIPGTSGSDSQHRGVLAGLASSPDIRVAGQVAGMWTDQVAQGEVQRWLATNPGQLDAIVVQSAAEMGVLRAVQQSGRGNIPVAIGGELGALCYWRKNPDYITAAYQVWPPADEIQLIWNIMMRTLQGQGPKVQSVLVDPVKITHQDLAEVMGEDCNEDSPDWLAVGASRWGQDPAYLDDFFLRPADPRAYKP
ncbi:ABC transporter substrate-binding protein [Stappia sp. TSB10GB4]|uniref:ABC transporter substrate-binding protein n=1 Tax=Stappia sp. TSB10GB4 TaxID=2003584 RepID=UPI001AD8D711|nr:ABC transporter substrate-binding protein [Stappia sp. TSB10GB4]